MNKSATREQPNFNVCNGMAAIVAPSLVLAIFLACAFAEHRGIISLDSITFDKVVGVHQATLVKFDKKYAYGQKEDQFKKFADKSATHPELLIAEVGATDWGEKENQDLMDKFGIMPEQYPVFKLFLKGKDPVNFSGDVTENDLLKFTTKNTGFWFGLPGAVEELDKLSHDFVQGRSDQYEKIIEEAEKFVGDLKDKNMLGNAKKYLNIMKKISSKGLGYVGEEIKRVRKMMKGKLTEPKKKSFETKLNILESFKYALNKKEEL